MTDPIKILMASDLHFGAPNVNQEDMADAFGKTIFPLLADTDIFFINGDFFDTLVIFDSHGFDPIADVMFGIMALCQEHQITLRIMQGTWTHDRNQLKRFVNFYRNKGCTFPFRLISGIELEEISIRDRSLRIMYVPDDLPFKSSDDIVAVVQDKLIEVGWDYVDYGCMHGFFEFTFPSGVSQENTIVFRETQFGFVKKVIDVGHVHQHRIQDAPVSNAFPTVISNGSLDRHCFGDEDPKGCIRILDYPDHYTALFIENKNAAVYDTLVFGEHDTTETIRQRISTHLKTLATSRIISLRCVIDAVEYREAIKGWMKEVYPEVRCVLKKSKDASNKPLVLPNSPLLTRVEKRIAPTPKTISSFIRSHIPEEYALTIDAIDLYLEPVSDKV